MAPTRLTELNDDVILCIFDACKAFDRRSMYIASKGSVVSLTATCQRLRRLGARLAFHKVGRSLMSSRQLDNLLGVAKTSSIMQANLRHIRLNMHDSKPAAVHKMFANGRVLQFLDSLHKITILEVSMPLCFALRFKPMIVHRSFPHVIQLTSCQRTIWLREKCSKLDAFTLRWREDEFLHWATNADFEAIMQELKKGAIITEIALRDFWFSNTSKHGVVNEDHKIDSLVKHLPELQSPDLESSRANFSKLYIDLKQSQSLQTLILDDFLWENVNTEFQLYQRDLRCAELTAKYLFEACRPLRTIKFQFLDAPEQIYGFVTISASKNEDGSIINLTWERLPSNCEPDKQRTHPEMTAEQWACTAAGKRYLELLWKD